ncbi:MAG: EcsC family protein [Candidatus Omnitrophica bacterium]|nr:EcsC family protein [Candidatus Omnitrophota bacterium]
MGGYAAILLDIPTLFAQNLKMISQIGASYGYIPGADMESEFALRVFAITTASGDEREEEMRKMDRLIETLAFGKFRKDDGITANRKSVLAFAKSVVRWLVKKRSMRGVMFVGMAVGGTLNYFFTKETAIYAYMFYRKRFLVEKMSRGKKDVIARRP